MSAVYIQIKNACSVTFQKLLWLGKVDLCKFLRLCWVVIIAGESTKMNECRNYVVANCMTEPLHLVCPKHLNIKRAKSQSNQAVNCKPVSVFFKHYL